MRFFWNAVAVAVFARLATADIVMHFDKALEGQVDKVEIITQAPGKVDSPAVFMSKGPPGDLLNKGEASKVKLTPKAALDLLLKRQYSCPSGYGYCSSFGRCCEEQYKCCPYGYCIDPTAACCPTGPCAAGKTCCGNSHCMPENATCCSDESFCYAGNHCYTFSNRAGMYCCTDNQCTAKVGADGMTTTAPTSTYTRTYTTTRTRYYYWTVTWYYYYYYWTYSAHIEASIVTSSRTSTSSTLSCYTTDASAASSYFESVSETLTFSTPASATSLESIAGQTSFVGSRTAESNPQPTQNEGDGGSGGGEGGNNSEPSSSESPSSTSRGPGSSGSSGGGGGSGGSASAARSLLSQLDAGFAAFLAFGATVGAIAIAL